MLHVATIPPTHIMNLGYSLMSLQMVLNILLVTLNLVIQISML